MANLGLRVLERFVLCCAQGDQGDKFYIVEAGVCVVRDTSGKDLMRVTPTMYFGELALLRNEVPTSDNSDPKFGIMA